MMKINYESLSDKYLQILFVAFAFFFPLSVALSNLVLVLLVLTWLLTGNYKTKFHKILCNPVAIASLLFFSFHLISMFWTTNLVWGLTILKKMQDFLIFLPVILTIVKKENIEIYLLSFFSAMTINLLITFFLYLNSFTNPLNLLSPEVLTFSLDRINYGIFLIFYIFLIVNYVSQINNNQKIVPIVLIAFSIFVILASGGRSAQITFFISSLVMFFLYRKFNAKNFISITAILLTIFIASFQFIENFQTRINQGYNELTNYIAGKSNTNMSVSIRLKYLDNSIDLIQENLLMGVGIGDFPDEYKKINKINSPEGIETVDPHSMYILTFAQLGIIGFLIFLYIFFVQVKSARRFNKKGILYNFGFLIPLVFGVGNLFNSYFLGHYATMLFIFFTAIVYPSYKHESI